MSLVATLVEETAHTIAPIRLCTMHAEAYCMCSADIKAGSTRYYMLIVIELQCKQSHLIVQRQ